MIVTLTLKFIKIYFFNIIEIFNKFKKYEYHQIKKFTGITYLRKEDFLSEEKISDWLLCKQKHLA